LSPARQEVIVSATPPASASLFILCRELPTVRKETEAQPGGVEKTRLAHAGDELDGRLA
jgi:hypothetical protein